MKIEFENSIRRLSFLCCLADIKIAWINPCILKNIILLKKKLRLGPFVFHMFF